jgi:hypothetical protein
MAMTSLNRQKAGSLTKGAQAALVVLLLAGGAALAFRAGIGSGLERPADGPVVLPVVSLGDKNNGPSRAAADVNAIAARLNMVSNHPTATDPVPVAAGVQPPPPPPPADLRYLGAVGVGNMNMALVMDGGKQRFVRVGDQLSAGKVESIDEGEIKIAGAVGAASRSITLATRGAEVLTRMHGSRPGMVRPASPGQPNNGFPAYTPPEQNFPQAGSNGYPDYVRPDDYKRFDEVRNQLRQSGQYGSDEELAEASAKMMHEKDSQMSPEQRKEMMIKLGAEKQGAEVKGKKP